MDWGWSYDDDKEMEEWQVVMCGGFNFFCVWFGFYFSKCNRVVCKFISWFLWHERSFSLFTIHPLILFFYELNEREKRKYPCTQSKLIAPEHSYLSTIYTTIPPWPSTVTWMTLKTFLSYITTSIHPQQRTTLFVTASCQKIYCSQCHNMSQVLPPNPRLAFPDWHFEICTFQANGLACQAKYEAGSIPSFAANASLFVKAHAY